MAVLGRLGKDAACLSKPIAQPTSLSHAFGLRRIVEGPAYEDAAERADLVCKSAKRAVICTAAANVALNFTSVELAQEGSKMVEQGGAELPKTLLALQATFKEERSRPGAVGHERSKNDDLV